MAANSSRMLDAVRDRIVILNASGRIAYTNAAARGDFSGELSAILASPELGVAVKQGFGMAFDRVIDLRIAPDPSVPEHSVEATVTRAPNGADVVVVVHPATDARGAGAGPTTAVEARTVAELLRQHVLDLMQRFVAAPDPTSPQARDIGRTLVERLQRVIDLVALFGDAPMIDEERILPAPLIEEAVALLDRVACKHRVHLVTTGFDVELPPIYGSRRWLLRAVCELASDVIALAHPDHGSAGGYATVEIAARQTGAFLLLDFRTAGRSMAKSPDGRVTATSPAASVRAAESPTGEVRIGLPLAQRVVELHGGLLRVRTSHDGTQQSTLQLPTGAPHQNLHRMDMEQARKYAEDLSRLLAGRRKGPGETTVTPTQIRSAS